MAVEQEILARIHNAVETGDNDQEQLNKALLGDLTYRKSQGLTDHPEMLQTPQTPEKQFTKYIALPKIDDPALQALIDKVNPVLGLMDDIVVIDDTMSSQEWGSMENDLTGYEVGQFRRSFNGLIRSARYGGYGTGPEGKLTFGDARKLSYDEILGMSMIGKKSATIIMHSIQPIDEASDT